MKAVTGKRMAKLAEQKGWILARINGSHHVFTKEGRIEPEVGSWNDPRIIFYHCGTENH